MTRDAALNNYFTPCTGPQTNKHGLELTAQGEDMEETKHNYQLFEKKIQDEIKELMKEIRSEVQRLDQHCMESIYYSETLFDLSELVDLKEQLEKTAEDLAQDNYAIVGGRGYSLHLWETDPHYLDNMRTRIEELANQG